MRAAGASGRNFHGKSFGAGRRWAGEANRQRPKLVPVAPEMSVPNCWSVCCRLLLSARVRRIGRRVQSSAACGSGHRWCPSGLCRRPAAFSIRLSGGGSARQRRFCCSGQPGKQGDSAASAVGNATLRLPCRQVGDAIVAEDTPGLGHWGLHHRLPHASAAGKRRVRKRTRSTGRPRPPGGIANGARRPHPVTDPGHAAEWSTDQ